MKANPASSRATEFHGNARNARTSAALVGSMCLLFLMAGAVSPDPIARWFGFGMSALCALLTVPVAIAALDKRVQLSIGPGGLLYRRFSSRTVPWSEIRAVVIIRTQRYWVQLNKRDFRHERQSDTINISVADLGSYPGGPGRWLSRAVKGLAGHPPIAIQTWFIDATTDQIAAAIRAHWPGDVAVMDIKAK